MPETIGKGVLEVGFDPQQVEAAGREQLLPSAQRLAKDLASTFAAVKLISIGKSGLEELENAQRVTTQTAVQLRAAGDSAGVTSDQIDKLGQSMEQLAGFDDEAARSAANVLLRFQAFQGIDQLKRVEGDAADLAITMGTDLPSAAELLGRALQSPENSARILKPAIGSLTDAQKDAITAFTQAGDAADAQGVILDAIESKVQGAAEQYGKTLPGGIDRATQSWKDAKATLVGGFAPAIELGANLTTDFAHAIQSLPAPAQDVIGALLLIGGTAASLVGPVSSLVNIYTQLSAKAATAAVAETELASASAASGAGFAAALGPIGLVVAGIGVLATIVALTGRNERNAVVDTADYTQALRDQSGALQDNIDKQTAHQLSQDKDVQAALQAGLSFKAVADAVRSGGEVFEKGFTSEKAFSNVSDAIRAAGPHVTDLGRELLALRDSGQITDAQLNDIVLTVQGLGSKLSDNKSQIDTETTALGQTGQAASATGQALLELATHEEVAAQSAKDLAAAQQQDNQERATRLSSVTALFTAEQSLSSAQQQLTQAERGETDAARAVEAARRRVTDALQSQSDAVQRLADAEAALLKAEQPASAEDLGKADLARSNASLHLADAQAAQAAAEKEASDARRDGKHTAAEVADLDRKAEEAKNAVTAATFAQQDAEQAYQDVQAKGTDQDQAVIDAKKQVDAATRGVAAANQAVTDSYAGVDEAQQRVLDSKDAVANAYVAIATATAGVKDAQDGLYSGASNATTALGNQASAFDAITGKLDPSSPLRKNIADYIGDLAVLRDIFAMDSSVPTEDILNRHTAPGQPSLRASGGSLRPNEIFARGPGERPELMFGSGLYQAPPTGGFIMTADQTEAWIAAQGGGRAGIHVDKIEVVNPFPEPASSSVGRELAILSDKYALVG